MRHYTFMIAGVVYLTLANVASAAWWEVGSGERKVLFWHTYDSKLLTRGEAYTPDKPFAIEHKYRTAYSKDELIGKTIREMRRHGKFDMAEQERWSRQLKLFLSDVDTNDRLRAEVKPNKQVRFFINGKMTGAINDALFAELYPQIWLGMKTSEPNLRKQLLAFNRGSFSRLASR